MQRELDEYLKALKVGLISMTSWSIMPRTTASKSWQYRLVPRYLSAQFVPHVNPFSLTRLMGPEMNFSKNTPTLIPTCTTVTPISGL